MLDYHATDCDGCGQINSVEREVDDYSPDCGTSYAPINGSSVEVGLPYTTGGNRLRLDWYCPACTAATLGFAAEFGCNVRLLVAA